MEWQSILHQPITFQGVDPDAPEEDEDNEVDDADGDQEETELLWWMLKGFVWFRLETMFLFLFLPIRQRIASKNDIQAEDSAFLVVQGDLENQESRLKVSDF